jgi:CDP-glycerol glycerophosphotransferase
MKIFFGIFIHSILCILSYIIPKNKNLFLFGAGDGIKFSDNSKYLYLYYIKETKIKAFWCTRNNLIYNKLIKNDLPVLKIGTLKHFFCLLRANYLFLGMSISDVSYIGFLPGKFNKIQGWHGTGFKKIALEDKNIKRRYSKLFWFVKKEFSSYKMILSSSEQDRVRKEKCFLNKNVFITGSPRNDVFFNRTLAEKNYKKELKLESYKKIILYVPTFREFGFTNPFTDSFWKELSVYLEKENGVFIIKKHYLDKNLKVPKNYNNIKDVTDKVSDVQELLLDTDLLITDYSSIATDYNLTNNPMIFYMYDYNTYIQKSRPTYYDLKEIFPKPFAYDEKKLLELIKDGLWSETKQYKKDYEKFKKMFHQFEDSNSSKRVAELISNFKKDE